MLTQTNSSVGATAAPVEARSTGAKAAFKLGVETLDTGRPNKECEIEIEDKNDDKEHHHRK